MPKSTLKSAINNPCDWWHYFDKINNGATAKCKNCHWSKPRGVQKSTGNLKYHLAHGHPHLYSQRLEAIRQKEKTFREKTETNKPFYGFDGLTEERASLIASKITLFNDFEESERINYHHKMELEECPEFFNFDRLVVIGGGKMARALIQSFLGSQQHDDDGAALKNAPSFTKEQVFICVSSAESAARWKSEGFFSATSKEFYELVEPGGQTLILLAIKPQEFGTFQKQINRHNSWAYWTDAQNTVVVSIMAGLTLENLSKGLRSVGSVFPGFICRLMPNLNANSHNGTLLFCAHKTFPHAMMNAVVGLASRAGSCTIIREKEMNAAASMSGCAPAFIYAVIEALADGGVLCGLSRSIAQRLAAEMVRGSAAHVLASTEHSAQLKDAVCSPGGTTIAGMRVLERAGMRSAFIEALAASTKRAEELGAGCSSHSNPKST